MSSTDGDELRDRIEELESQVEELEVDVDDKQDRIAALEGEVEDLQVEIEEKDREIEDKDQEIEEKDDEIAALKVELEKIKSDAKKALYDVRFGALYIVKLPYTTNSDAWCLVKVGIAGGNVENLNSRLNCHDVHWDAQRRTDSNIARNPILTNYPFGAEAHVRRALGLPIVAASVGGMLHMHPGRDVLLQAFGLDQRIGVTEIVFMPTALFDRLHDLLAQQELPQDVEDLIDMCTRAVAATGTPRPLLANVNGGASQVYATVLPLPDDVPPSDPTEPPRGCAAASGSFGLSKGGKPRVKCPDCGRIFTVNNDGTIHKHKVSGAVCPGSGRRL